MNNKVKQQLTAIAKKNNDVDLALVVGGEIDIWDYLINLVDDDKGYFPLGGNKRHLKAVMKSNAKRAHQLSSWISKDDDAKYVEFYQAELDILNDYALTALFDILNQSEALSELGSEAKEQATKK